MFWEQCPIITINLFIIFRATYLQWNCQKFNSKEVFFRFLTQFWENCRFSKSKKWTVLKLHYDLSKDILFISDSRYKSNFWNTFTWFLKDLGSPIPLVVVCLTSNAQFVHCEKKNFFQTLRSITKADNTVKTSMSSIWQGQSKSKPKSFSSLWPFAYCCWWFLWFLSLLTSSSVFPSKRNHYIVTTIAISY